MRPNKFKAQRTEVDGIMFASKAEARRYSQLKLLERAGEILFLRLQPRFVLNGADGSKACTYIADFEYVDAHDGALITEDVKGVATPTFKLKAKLFEAQYGRPVTIVRMRS